MTLPEKTGYAPANGLDLYFEVYGSGDPVVALRGGLGSIEIVAPVLPRLAAGRQAIAFDLQGHGRTADIDRPLRFEDMADDVAAALDHLGLGQVDIIGYSLGAGVALQLAVRHRRRIRRLVLVSFPFRKSGWYPEINHGMSRLGPASVESLAGSPLDQIYRRVAPHPENWLSLHTKLHDLLTQDYDWGDKIGEIQAPTLLIAGDADAIPPTHIAEFYQLLGGGRRDAGWDGSAMSSARLAILAGATHYNILTLPILAQVIDSFFTLQS